MSQGERTVSGSRTASVSTQPPPYSATPPFLVTVHRVGVVRRMKEPSPDDEAHPDYIPPVSGSDHPEYLPHGPKLQKITSEELSQGNSPSSSDAYDVVKESMEKFIEKLPPIEDQGMTAEERLRMDRIAAKLYSCVGRGEIKMRFVSAPTMFGTCACANEEDCKCL